MGATLEMAGTQHRNGGIGIVLLLIVLVLSACATDAGASRPQAGQYSRATVKSMVTQEAARLGIPISLALAVAHAESNYNAGAESSKGARGVMQVMPATAVGEYGIHPDLLWDPRINIRLGLHFLGRLLERYNGRVDLALSYYNGGSAVGSLPHARVIPATFKYVARVKRLQRQYRRKLYLGGI